MKKEIILFFCILCTVGTARSQVTVGSDIIPNNGALLDLKQTNAEGVNSEKGLGAPRVHLTDFTRLYPMFSDTIDYVSNVGGRRDKENNAHTGLLVYNVANSVCDSPYIGDGLYIWDGERWIYLGQDKSNVMHFKDQDGNPFKARRFGMAGIWMTENLRATSYVDGTPGLKNNATPSDTERYFCYPAPRNNPQGVIDGTNDTYFTMMPSMGLLYNRAAATNLENNSTKNQAQTDTPTPGPNEVESVAPNGRIRGICPEGWHLPSDREWNDLEEEIYNNPHRYSTYTTTEAATWNPLKWNSIWDTWKEGTPTTPRGSSVEGQGHGLAMLSPCPLPDSPYTGDIKGRSLLSVQGGFEALMVGLAYEGALSFGVDEYGVATSFMTSSNASIPNTNFWYRTLGVYQGYKYNKQYVARHELHPGGVRAYFSVRCKKDE